MANALIFLASVLLWGTTWIAMKMQVGPVAPLASVFYRFLLAAPIMAGIVLARGRMQVPALRHHPYLIVQALCLFSFNFISFYAAARYMPSAFNAVVFSLATVFNALNARVFFGERVSGRALIAGALGALGVALLFAHDIGAAMGSDALKGAGLAVMGTMFFSLGNMASRRNGAAGLPLDVVNAWGMSYGALILLATMLATGTAFTPPPDARYVGALLYLAVFGSVAGFAAYLTLVARLGPAKAAYATVFFPVVALVISTLFEGYVWTPLAFLGVALTMIGNVVMFWSPRRR